jgi:hypothetical protein
MNFYELQNFISKIEIAEALSHVSNKDFIKKVFEADKLGENAEWVASELGCSRTDVRSKINYFIKNGVNIPTLIKQKDTYDDYEKRYIEITKQIINHKKNGERLPVELRNWITNMKRAKAGVLRPTLKGDFSPRRWYPILDKIAAEEGYPDLFAKPIRKSFSDDDWAKTSLIVDLLKEKKSLTAELEQWIIKQSLNKLNKSEEWYPMLERIAETKGYTGLFNNPDSLSLKAWLIFHKLGYNDKTRN